MELTVELLKKIAPTATTKNIQKYLPFLNHALPRYEINTPLRISAFLSQVLVESGAFFYSEEIASGKAYEGRKDLGNVEVGDGVKFKGRGLIQTTGRANYQQVKNLLGIDCVSNPELLEEPKWCVETACLYWKTRKLNAVADTGDVKKVSKIVNGGYNHLTERTAYYEKANTVLS
jgi:putative chitinase